MEQLKINDLHGNYITAEPSKTPGYVLLDTGVVYGLIFEYAYVCLSVEEAKQLQIWLAEWIKEHEAAS